MNNQLPNKAYFVVKGLLLPIVIAVLPTFQIARAEDKAEGYVCVASAINNLDAELQAISKKYHDADESGKSKEKEKFSNQFFEKLESKVREKCKPGDIIHFSSKYWPNYDVTVAELLCDFNKTIFFGGVNWSQGTCVLAPHRGIRPLQ